MGDYLTLNLNLNLPPPCTTGFIPTQQQRIPSLQDYPDRAPGDVYCRIPQDAPFNVRGARNLPCVTVPGKRAPTAKSVRATRITFHSTTATTGRVTPAAPCPASPFRNFRPAHHRPKQLLRRHLRRRR